MRRSQKLILLGIFILIALFSVRVGKEIMGFDNSSPFFSFAATWSRIFTTDNFFHYGGMLFAPALYLSLIGVPAWINSHITYLGALVIGMFFSAILIGERTKKANSPVLALILLGNLVPIWAFSIPILIFAPSFAGIPTLIYFLTREEKSRELWIELLMFIGIIYFYSTSINVAAFTLYFIEAIGLAFILKNSKLTIGTVVKRASVIALVWIVIVQSILLFRPHPSFILTEAIGYGNAIAADNKSTEVTSSIFLMEAQRNSIVNVARFATGWVSLTDGEQKYISPYKDILDSYIGVIVTVIPTLLALFFISTQWKVLTKQKRILSVVWIGAILLSTSYALIFTKAIPYLGTVLRWISSKLWPLIFIPFTILLYESLTTDKIHKYAKVIVTLCLFCIALPWLFGIVNKHQQNTIPQSYLSTFKEFSNNETVLYLPMPQRLYMRQYQWGYYGSSFVTYLTKARILDNGSFHPEQNIYTNLVVAFNECNIAKLRTESLIIVVDDSTISGKVSIPSCYDSYNQKRVGELTIIRF